MPTQNQRIIEVSPYSAEWPALYAREHELLESTLGEIVISIQHIGSTSVPGLMAKPIIDILLVVNSLEKLDTKTLLLEAKGYESKGEFGIKGRRYFQKGGDHRIHHIHAFVKGAEPIDRHLAFRDYLIAFPEVAKEYQDLKLQVLKQCNNDIGLYCDGKDRFVKTHEKLAIKWRSKP